MDILIEHEKALHKYEIRQSFADVSRLIHPSFREIGESGRSYDFSSIVDMMAVEEPSSSYIHSQDYECIQLAPSIQLLLYKSTTVSESGVISHYAKRSSIWEFTGTQWQMKFHQGTGCEAFNLIR